MRTIFLVTCFSLLITKLFAQKEYHNFNSLDTLVAAVNAYDEGKYDRAIQLFDRVSESDTNYIIAQYEKALTLIAQEKNEEAIEICMKFKDIPNANQIEFYNLLGTSLDHLKRGKESIEMYNEALKLAPYNTNLLLNKGVSFISEGMVDSAEATFQKAVKINFFHPSLHAKLGQLYLNQGRTVPAMYAFITYLSLAPGGMHAANSISSLYALSIEGYEPIDSIKNPFPKEDAHLKDITKIIDSKMSFSRDYKVKSKLKDNMVKQLHIMMSQTPHLKNKDNFVDYYYVRLYKDLLQNKHFTPLSYLWFVSVNSSQVQGLYRKNQKKIDKTITYFANLIKKTQEFKKATIEGKTAEYYHWYNEAGLDQIGNAKLINGVYRPDGLVYIYQNGKKVGHGNYKNGLYEGELYVENIYGIPLYKINFKKGVRHGLYTNYHPNGARKQQIMYNEGKIEGEVKIYNTFDILVRTFTSTSNSIEGKEEYFSKTGYVYNSRTYKSGKLSGYEIVHNKWNDIKDTVQYDNGIANGKTVYYYPSGKVRLKGEFKEDKYFGKWVSYHQSGNIAKEMTYNENGKLEGMLTTYYSDGVIESKELFSNGKKTGKSEYFDIDGKIWYYINYKNDKLKSFGCYDKTGKAINEEITKGKTLQIMFYHPDGALKNKGKVVNEEYEGEYTSYYNNGKIESKCEYKKGLIEGTYYEYFPNGKTDLVQEYKDGVPHGLTKSYYRNGNLYSEGMYENGNRNGDWYYYYPDGTISGHEFYLNGTINGWDHSYQVDGKLKNSHYYDLGVIEEIRYYDTTGNVIYTNDLRFGSGDYKTVYWNGAKRSESKMVANQIHGTHKFYYPDGKLFQEKEFVYGDVHGKSKAYYNNGQLYFEANYKFGEKEGYWKYFTKNGKTLKEGNYEIGKAVGTWKYYDSEGTLYSIDEYHPDFAHGGSSYILPDGSLGVKKIFDKGVLIGYTYLGKDGKEVPMIPVNNETAEIVSYHPNGQIACKQNIVNGYIEGDREFYYPNGTLYTKKPYIHSKSSGTGLYYYSNGKIEIERDFYYGDDHGVLKKYRPDGSIKYIEHYLTDLLHGVKEYYDKSGKIVKTEKYVYGELFE